MSNDERPESLAAQAAAWVPPWERQRPEPDRAYQAAHRAEAEEELRAAELADGTDQPDPDPRADDEPDAPGGPDRPGEPEEPGEADWIGEAEEAGEAEVAGEAEKAGQEPDPVPDELPQLPGEVPGAPTVDAPQERPDEPREGPTELALGAEVPLPEPVEEAVEEAPANGGGTPVDAPLTPEAATPEAATPEAGTPAVPAQGRRRRDGDAAVGGPTSRTFSGWGLPGDAERAAVDGARPAPAAPTGDDARNVEHSDPDDADGPVAVVMDDAELAGALEAIMLVVDEPVGELQLGQILQQPAERVAATLDDLSARYTAAGHGFDLRRVAGGWRLYTRPEYAAYVERFVLDGQSVRLTQAALETLAVVAYKQPVTRSRISAIRGVNCDGVMRTLATRGLIEECGIEGETGAHLYRTTPLFLEKLGINSVDELPPLAPFLPDDVEEVLDASG